MFFQCDQTVFTLFVTEWKKKSEGLYVTLTVVQGELFTSLYESRYLGEEKK